MADREYLQYVEVDFDYCSRSFGSDPCVANLGQNLLLWSEDLSNAAWIKSNTAVVSNQAKDPEGFVTADKVTNTAVNGIYFQTYTPASLANKTYTFSFWVNTSPGEVITARAYLYGSVGLENITFTDLALTGGPQLISRSITFGAVPASPSLVIRVDLLGASGKFLFSSFASLVEGPLVKGYSKTEGTRITGDTEFTTSRKCFNTFATCSDKANFDKIVKTQTFVMNRSSLPGLLSAYPTLDSVSSFTSTVNLSGGDARYGAFGRRGEVTVTLRDHIDSDSLFDKYYKGRKAGTAQADATGYNVEDFGIVDIANVSKIPVKNLYNGQIQEYEFSRMLNAAGKRAGLPLWIAGHSETSEERPMLTMSDVFSICSNIVHTQGKNIRFIMLDYLQRINRKDTKERESRLQFSAVMDQVKNLALTYKTCVFIGSQVRRDMVEKAGENRQPQAHWAMETSNFEHSCDGLISVWMPYMSKDKYKLGDTLPSAISGEETIKVSRELIIMEILKQKKGGTGTKTFMDCREMVFSMSEKICKCGHGISKHETLNSRLACFSCDAKTIGHDFCECMNFEDREIIRLNARIAELEKQLADKVSVSDVVNEAQKIIADSTSSRLPNRLRDTEQAVMGAFVHKLLDRLYMMLQEKRE